MEDNFAAVVYGPHDVRFKKWPMPQVNANVVHAVLSKMTENSAAVLHGPYDVRIEKCPVPQIVDNEVLIKMECVGICGSDVKLYSTGKCGFEELKEPLIIGHEGAGIVAKVGANVTNLKVGDRVAIEPTQPCRRCGYCKQGKYNVCDKPHYCSTTDAHGNLCSYYKHVADFCHKIPANLTLEEGAAIQPLAIAIHACNRAGLKLGSRLAIIGAGPIGVLCAMTAKAMGVAKIIITDVVASRLETAKQLGADYTLLTTKEDSDDAIVAKITAALGSQPDTTIDACGYPVAQCVALKVTKTGGVVLVVGIGSDTVQLPLSQAMLREVDIRGSFRIANTYPAAIEAVSSGAINLKPFITHHFPLEKAKEALDTAKAGTAMKIIIHLPK